MPGICSFTPPAADTAPDVEDDNVKVVDEGADAGGVVAMAWRRVRKELGPPTALTADNLWEPWYIRGCRTGKPGSQMGPRALGSGGGVTRREVVSDTSKYVGRAMLMRFYCAEIATQVVDATMVIITVAVDVIIINRHYRLRCRCHSRDARTCVCARACRQTDGRADDERQSKHAQQTWMPLC